MKITQSAPDAREVNIEHVVEFYPSFEDYAYIATRIGDSVPANTLAGYAYYVFLILNVIVFPAFLWIAGYFITGTIVFVVNVLAVMIIIPRVNSDGYRKYYKQLFGNRENEIARVTLNPLGATYESDEGSSFWPWKRIYFIEETEESIYFFFDGNGFAVRKNGFAYEDDAKSFIDHARHHIDSAITNRISP